MRYIEYTHALTGLEKAFNTMQRHYPPKDARERKKRREKYHNQAMALRAEYEKASKRRRTASKKKGPA
jgi:hypothetical protein